MEHMEEWVATLGSVQRLQNYEYADALVTMLLAYELGSNPTVAIKRAARRVKKRLKCKNIRIVLDHICKQRQPAAYLQNRINQIEKQMPIGEFIYLGHAQKPDNYDRLEREM